MEKSLQKQKQSTLDAFIQKKNSSGNHSNFNALEPEIIIEDPFSDFLAPQKHPLYSKVLYILPLPHHNHRVWGVAKPIFQGFRDKKIKNLKGFLEEVYQLVSISEKYPNLTNLETFFSMFSEAKRSYFLQSILPALGTKALAIEDPKQFPQKIERLNQGVKGSVKLTKGEVSILIVHMFFCTFFTEKGDYKSYNKKEHSVLNKSWNFEKIFRMSKKYDKNPIKVYL